MFSKGGMEGIREGVKKGFMKDSSLWRKRKGGNGEEAGNGEICKTRRQNVSFSLRFWRETQNPGFFYTITPSR